MDQKFSEAMASGLSEIRFTNHHWLRDDELGVKECTGCLIGAALYASGERSAGGYTVHEQLAKHWPWIREISYDDFVLCPHGCSLTPSYHYFAFQDFVTHIAEHYVQGEMSMDEITKFFQGLEDKYNPPKPEPTQQTEEGQPVEEPEYSCT